MSKIIGASYHLNAQDNVSVYAGNCFMMKSEKDFKIDTAHGFSIDSAQSASFNSAKSIQFSCGKSSLVLNKDGTILLKGKYLKIDVSDSTDIDATREFTIKSGKISLN